ncbi:Uncharacterised protein [Mycobacteroides abscessus]|nr:Uncharacterised protein [Mycobacteroides abscessus]
MLAQRAEPRPRGAGSDVPHPEERCGPGTVREPHGEETLVVRGGTESGDRDERVERGDARAVLGLEGGELVVVRPPRGGRHRPASRASGAPSGRPSTTHSWSAYPRRS